MSELQLLSYGYLLFVVLIGGELLYSRFVRRDRHYSLGQGVANVGHGVVFQVFDGFTKALVFAPFLLVASLADPVLSLDSWWGWLLGFVLYDLSVYWRHRHHHEIGALWTVHGVHHAATDFNFAAALRQAIFGNVTGWPWQLPLALIMPVEMFVVLVVVDYVYQFVQHTRYVPKLGPIEWVFNTPSPHRVHHGTEAKYLDRNYGGMLIVWDRLFRTFQVEEEEPTYGLTIQLHHLDPVWGNFALVADLGRAAWAAPSWKDRLLVVFGSPVRVAPVHVRRVEPPRPDAAVPPGRFLYVLVTFASLPVLLGALAWVPSEALELRLAVGVLALAGAVAAAARLQQRAWASALDLARLVAALGLLPFAGEPLLVAGLLSVPVGMLCGLAAGSMDRVLQRKAAGALERS